MKLQGSQYTYVGLNPDMWELLLNYLDEDNDPDILKLYWLIKHQITPEDL